MTMTMTSNQQFKTYYHIFTSRLKKLNLKNKVILRHNSLNITESDIYANFI